VALPVFALLLFFGILNLLIIFNSFVLICFVLF